MMDCTRCQDLLLEYLDGTLDEVTAKEVQAELQHCAECRAVEAQLRNALSLSAQLPVAPMPDSLHAKLIAAADSHAAKAAAGDNAKTSSGGGFFGGLFEQLQALLSGPQAAMATLLVLIVAGTVFVAPVLLPSPEAVNSPKVASEAPQGEPSPAAAAPIAAATEADREDSVPTADEDPEAEAVAEEAPADKPLRAPNSVDDLLDRGLYETQEKASRPQLERSTKGKASVRGVGSLGPSSQRNRAKRATAATPKKSQASRSSDDALSGLDGRADEGAATAPERSGGGRGATAELREESAYAPPPPAAKEAAQKAERLKIDDLLQNALGSAPASTSAPKPAPAPASAYVRGMQAYGRGDFRTAAALLPQALNEAQTKAERDSARRSLAISLKRLGRCKDALRHFERLLEDGPLRWRAAIAQDAAACYETLGQKDAAARLRERYQ